MKTKTIIIITTLMLCIMLSAANGFADVPAPPVNQVIGMLDTELIENVTEADCRVCHASGLPDRHHLLYYSVIPDPSLVPYPDSDGDGVDDTNYSCLSCHDDNFMVVRNCVVCHTESPHHTTATADGGHCVACHGDIVDDMDDGHYIPEYNPSLVTPWRGLDGDDGEPVGGEPLNSYGFGAGSCTYCHDADVDPSLGDPIVIFDSHDTHHHAGWNGLAGDADSSRCRWCHTDDFVDGDRMANFNGQIRACEKCHGPDSLHNIQADSLNPNNIGTIVVGGEDAGYGHVGRDAGPGDSDCWGCHGFGSASAPVTGPTTPYLSDSNKKVIVTGTDTTITLNGSSLTNYSGTTKFESNFILTPQDGSVTLLAPEHITSNSATLIIPGNSPAGNYKLRATKMGKDIFTWTTSNPVSISIKEPIAIESKTVRASCGDCEGTVLLEGHGFGDTPPAGTETYINVMQNNVPLNITSWTDTLITATGAVCDGSEITVNGLFGSATK